MSRRAEIVMSPEEPRAFLDQELTRWGGQGPSLAGYVTVMGATDGVTAAGDVRVAYPLAQAAGIPAVEAETLLHFTAREAGVEEGIMSQPFCRDWLWELDCASSLRGEGT